MCQFWIQRFATLLLRAQREFVEYRLFKCHLTLVLPSQYYQSFHIALSIVTNSINHRNVLNNVLFYISAFLVRYMISLITCCDWAQSLVSQNFKHSTD